MKKGTILIVDDNRSILAALKILLSSIFEKIITLPSPKQLKTTLRENSVDVVLLDMNFSSGVNNGNEGLYWLSQIKKEHPNGIQVVLITAYADLEIAIEGMKKGACDFIVKPWENHKLISTLKNAYALAREPRKDKVEFKDENRMFWGDNKEMLKIKELINKVAVTDANILITGENGTGKEMLAREIHRLSQRSNHEMVTVDMGSISESLFESELFGHIKGAFTDARNDRTGKFEDANNSTIFLDEIGNIPLHLQSKLLTVLQTRKVVKVGSNKPIDLNIRLITATNQDLQTAVASGNFRMDLMYRINTISIRLIPLRERREDIIPLALNFIQRYNLKYNKEITDIQPNAAEKLKTHVWNGNIRELQHTIEKAVIISSGTLLTENDFTFSTQTNEEIANSEVSTLEDMECKMIKSAIEKHNSNLSLVALSLGISRQTLYNKMRKFNI